MWLLSTDRAELHFFLTSDAVDGGYVILSHTWSDDESTFQDIQELKQRCRISGRNPRDLVPPKIRNCCMVAERHAFQWVWIDTCCIDKTSSTELSEAINSMFRWYAASEMCYAFLADVPSDDVLAAHNSAFRRARWHTRGWTLQELIAPVNILFFSKDWLQIGGKKDIAVLLEEVTGVRREVLTHKATFSSLSIAERMSWASKRMTTRIEDEAYCLLGLFGVNIPTIYGEGRQAFRRLQEEIMKLSFDSSLFVWGDWVFHDTHHSIPPSDRKDGFNGSVQLNLLAPTPHSFIRPFGGRVVEFTPTSVASLQPYLSHQWKPEHSHLDVGSRREKGPFGVIELPEFAITSYGLKCRFPVADLGEGYILIVLLCHTDQGHVGLLLHEANDVVQDPTKKRYTPGYVYRTSGVEALVRLTSLGEDFYNLKFNAKSLKAEWRNIYIVNQDPPNSFDRGLSLFYPLNCITPTPPFRVPHWLISRLELLDMVVVRLVVDNKPIGNQSLVVQFNVFHLSSTLDGASCYDEGFSVALGTCARNCPAGGHFNHWAKATVDDPKYDFSGWDPEIHDCHSDHIATWPGFSKTFGCPSHTIRLSFTPCQFAPQQTLVLHLELEGWAHAEIQRRANVWIPPLSSLPAPALEYPPLPIVTSHSRP